MNGQTLELVARKGCGISILGVIQTLTGHGLRNLFWVTWL